MKNQNPNGHRTYLADLYEILPVGVSVTDENGTFIDVNQPHLEIFGFDRDEIIGFSIPKLVSGISADEIMARYRRFMTGGPSTAQSEFRSIRKDGRQIFMSLRARRCEGKDGKPFAVNVVSDITGRRQMEILTAAQRDLALTLDAAIGFEPALRACLSTAIRVSETDCGGIYLLSPETGDLDLAAHQGLPETFVQTVSHYPADAPNTQLVLRGEPVYGPYPPPGVRPDAAERMEGLREIAVVPIQHEGQVLGALNVATRSPLGFSSFCRDALAAVAFQIASRIDRFQRDAQLERRRRADALIAATARRIVREPAEAVERIIAESLGELGLLAGADRVRMWRFLEPHDEIHLCAEWRAEGIDPIPPEVTRLPMSQMPWWFKQMRNQEPICFPRIDYLPEEAQWEKTTLERQGVRSLAMAPMVHEGRLIGCAGFHAVTREKRWNVEDHLQRPGRAPERRRRRRG